jgi:hypothetical protein
VVIQIVIQMVIQMVIPPVIPPSNASGVGTVAVRRVATVILQLLLVVLDLLLDSVGRQGEGMSHVGISVRRDELVFVFAVGENFHPQFAIPVPMEIHRHHNGGQAVEEVKQLLGAALELCLRLITQVPVSGGDCHLHR